MYITVKGRLGHLHGAQHKSELIEERYIAIVHNSKGMDETLPLCITVKGGRDIAIVHNSEGRDETLLLCIIVKEGTRHYDGA